MGGGPLRWVALLVLCGACSEVSSVEADTQVVLRVQAAPELRARITHLKVALYREDGEDWSLASAQDVPARSRWPLDLPVVPQSRGALEKRFEARVEAFADAQRVAQARAVSAYARGSLRVLEIQLFACTTLPADELCSPDTCHGEGCLACAESGQCEPVGFAAPETLLTFLPDEIPAAVAARADGGADGGTVAEPDDGGGEEGPLSSGGADAGDVDAGPRCDPACGQNAECVVSGSSATCKCLPGHELVGEQCVCVMGTACALVNCGPLPSPSQGTVSTTGGTTYGHKATYRCSAGFKPSSAEPRQCEASGTWSGAAVTCDAITCPELAAPANGSVVAPSRAVGQSATYTCAMGYLPSSATQARMCQADGTWSGAAGSCSPAFVDLAAGDLHVCARRTDGSVACWGAATLGRLGSIGYNENRPVVIDVWQGATAIACGGDMTCALKADRSVVCSGANMRGQLGNGDTSNSNVPVAVSLLNDAVELVARTSHACVRRMNGGVGCWGENYGGALGNGSELQSATIVPVTGLSNVTALAAGGWHNCARRADATAVCWGLNVEGAIGDGTQNNALTPVPVADLTNVASLAGGGRHTCAVKTDGTAGCWGANNYGQVGVPGAVMALRYAPITQLTGVAEIAAGAFHTCARKTSGAVLCWGFNNMGQVGNGTTTDAPVPVAVSGLSNATKLALGVQFSCALKSDGRIACWGYGSYGSLGDGASMSSPVPVDVLIP